ncbi:hypothetical protein RJ640_021354 [Escallonia rubra]|uniref:WPP domain-containing protein n=1 Tax=Escallonia rubra TaxID=112253 RepID=A0AA88QGQ9_9ASTE|nr:hypothetical protein RJ640_021354 [Escallonia rubra]
MAAEAPPRWIPRCRKASRRRCSFSIWPPTQRTRDVVLSRLIETLSAPSMLSKHYGSVPAGSTRTLSASPPVLNLNDKR